MPNHRRLAFLIVFLAGVAVTFWMVSRYPALSSKAALSGTAAFEDPMTHEAYFHVENQAPLYERIFYTTLNWYETNWRGMTFGLVLAGAFLTLLGYLPKKSSDRRFRNSFLGMFVGTPLGVCVNCVAPIAKGIYEAGSKMETALAVMFSSPTLNIVVLTMLFSIFPFYMAVLKLGATFLLVLLIVPLISEKTPAPDNPSVCEIDRGVPENPGPETWGNAFTGACRDYWKSFRYIVVRTVPLMLLAGFLGALLSHLWSFDHLIGVPVNLINLGLISMMGTFLPLPIAFDIMLAQALMMSGLASGFVMTLLFTLGTFSIYSALIVYRTFSLGLAVKLCTIIFLLGIGLGYAANFWSEYTYIKWLERYDKIVGAGSAGAPKSSSTVHVAGTAPDHLVPYPAASRSARHVFHTDQISIESIPHQKRNRTGDSPFSKFSGPDFGITYSNLMTPRIFFDPFYFGRGIASGDFNGDGWTDIAVATDNGFELYQNIAGKAFKKVPVPNTEIRGKQALNIAMVDMNNDGRLDIFFTTFEEGNYLWLNPGTEKKTPRVIPVPNNHALFTSAVAFADLNRDGFPDLVNGNYYLGVLTRTPIDTSIDQVVINRSLDFSVSDLPGVPGQTHTALLSDINNDAAPDLMIGNDYLVSDTYYLGTREGGFNKIRKQDGIIPVTTENTMSMDTGDVNNDLIPDIYLANIGFTRGIDVVSNIFGDAMQEAGRAFCDSGTSVLNIGECRNLLKLVTLLNPEKQDITERCTALADPGDVKDCMVTRMALLAARKNDPSLCDKLSRGHAMGQTLCRKFFEPNYLRPGTGEEIPLRSLSNILLLGKEDHTFEDISGQTGTTTAEWSWNARFADLDNDEWQDLYVVNGVLITQEFASNNFFHNQQGKTFIPAEEAFGLADRDHSSSYTYLDIDNDGDLDIIGNTLYGPFKVYINNETKNNSITFRLRDERGNRFCLGCRIIIHYGPGGERKQFREIKAGGGFHSFDAPAAHFGLGRFDGVSRIEIRWSTGETTTVDHPLAGNSEYIVHRKGGEMGR